MTAVWPIHETERSWNKIIYNSWKQNLTSYVVVVESPSLDLLTARSNLWLYMFYKIGRWLQNHSIKSDYCRLMADINPRRVGWVGR